MKRVDLIDRFQIQERLERSHRGNGGRGNVDFGIQPLPEVGRLQQVEEPRKAND
jgi:hypothetical protein